MLTFLQINKLLDTRW